MSYFFSATDNAFYPLSMRQQYTDAGTWPENGIQVSDDIFNEFTGPAPAGKIRGVVNEMPAWVDLPPPTPRQLIDQAEQNRLAFKSEADTEIAWRQDAVDAGIATNEEASELTDWKKYRVLLMRIDATKAPSINWPPKPGAQAN
ncbi:tail fiber assembly protein [Citrobacter freundii]|uniref:tail fiber assembly protein n=1 Tax=Citrobacter freundii complex TaxID=1344959 RepID=UPI001A2205A7|nr:tail fiber assembly protein [Citrobacter freundii]MCW1446119.1 tail fiber assembly protein [Citrobacter freundii]HAT3689741.1 tail fiber assembly protein [Citrobacter freundii]